MNIWIYAVKYKIINIGLKLVRRSVYICLFGDLNGNRTGDAVWRRAYISAWIIIIVIIIIIIVEYINIYVVLIYIHTYIYLYSCNTPECHPCWIFSVVVVVLLSVLCACVALLIILFHPYNIYIYTEIPYMNINTLIYI